MTEKSRNASLVGEESGIALIVTVLMLLLVSAIGVSALNRASDEKVISTASRRQVANLAAADAGLRVVRAQLQGVAGTSAAMSQSIQLNDQSMFLDSQSGLPTSIRTGTIVNGGVVDTVQQVGTGGIEEGDEIGLGNAQASSRRAVYRVNITATDPTGGNTQVQAQFSVAVPNN